MKKYFKIFFSILAFILLFVIVGQAVTDEVKMNSNDLSKCLTLVKDYPLPGAAKRIDYQSVDKNRSLLFIAHLGDNSVTVFNLKSSTVIKNIKNIPKPHGILVVSQLNKVYISATGVNEIYVLDEESLTIIDKVPAGNYPDGLAYDPNTKRIFVSDEHGGTVSVINTINDSILSTINIGGEVGNTHFDSVSNLIYSVNQSTDELIEIDPVSLKIASRYKLPGCEGAHGFFIEPETHYAFITGEGNGSYVVFDLKTKKIIASGKIGAGPDVLAFDKDYHLMYVASESGFVSIFKVGKGAIKKICEGFLAPNAHTVAVDQMTHKVYFPLQDINGKAVLRVMEPSISEISK